MILSYLITALRAFKNQKQHFILNVLGLSVGLAAAILVALFAKNELSYCTIAIFFHDINPVTP